MYVLIQMRSVAQMTKTVARKELAVFSPLFQGLNSVFLSLGPTFKVQERVAASSNLAVTLRRVR